METDQRNGKRCQAGPGFNVIGYASTENGIGVTTRNFIRLLLQHNCPLAIYDMNAGNLSDRGYSRYAVKSICDLPHAINFFILPARDAVQFIFPEVFRQIFQAEKFNVFLPVWELDVLPNLWVKALAFYDLIVSYSDFVGSTCRKYLPRKPIIAAEHPLYLPASSKIFRKFRLPKFATVFIFSFEPRSDVQRKNPYAVIRAFKLAFKTVGNVRLVIKINSAYADCDYIRHVRRIRQMCGKDKRIRLITAACSYADVLSLYRQCDVFVSLHRAEGFGLGPMEAMMMGKPVIATGWSGNMSYMNSRNACLVNYKLIPAKGNLKFYRRSFVGKRARWAEPSIRDAARWMRRLVQNPDVRRKIGEVAAASVATYQNKAQSGMVIKKILSRYRSWKLTKLRCDKRNCFVHARGTPVRNGVSAAGKVLTQWCAPGDKIGFGRTIRHLETILKIDPGNVSAQHYLSLLLHKVGRIQSARYRAGRVFDMIELTAGRRARSLW